MSLLQWASSWGARQADEVLPLQVDEVLPMQVDEGQLATSRSTIVFGQYTHMRSDGRIITDDAATVAYCKSPPRGCAANEAQPQPSIPVTLEDAQQSGDVEVLTTGPIHEAMVGRRFTPALVTRSDLQLSEEEKERKHIVNSNRKQ